MPVWAGGERQSTHNPHLNLFVEIAAVSVRMLKSVVSVLDYIFFLESCHTDTVWNFSHVNHSRDIFIWFLPCILAYSHRLLLQGCACFTHTLLKYHRSCSLHLHDP